MQPLFWKWLFKLMTKTLSQQSQLWNLNIFLLWEINILHKNQKTNYNKVITCKYVISTFNWREIEKLPKIRKAWQEQVKKSLPYTTLKVFQNIVSLTYLCSLKFFICYSHWVFTCFHTESLSKALMLFLSHKKKNSWKKQKFNYFVNF